MSKEEIIERLEEIAKHAVHVLGEKPFFMSLDDGIAIHEAIDILKSAQPERKKGRWINHRNDNGHNIADCDQCGEAMQWFDDDIKPNYCPNCGADMRKIE